jgi:hypothetical protein
VYLLVNSQQLIKQVGNGLGLMVLVDLSPNLEIFELFHDRIMNDAKNQQFLEHGLDSNGTRNQNKPIVMKGQVIGDEKMMITYLLEGNWEY